MDPEGEKQPDTASPTVPAKDDARPEPRLPSRTVPAVVMMVQGLLGAGGMLACVLGQAVPRFAVGTFAAVLEIVFAVAILVTKAEPRKEAVRTFAVRYVMVLAVGSLLASLGFGSSEVTGLHLVWSFALLGVLLGEPTMPRVGLCVSALLLFDAMFFVGIAKHAFVR